MFWCKLFGHHYSITSAMGNYAFCSRCGDTLTIKDPYALSPGERRYMHGMLFEMTEFGLEEVKQDEKTFTCCSYSLFCRISQSSDQ